MKLRDLFVRRRQVLILHLRKDHKIRRTKKKQGFRHISLSSLASAPLSCTSGRWCGCARCQTLADVCENWRLHSTARWQSRRRSVIRHGRAPDFTTSSTEKKNINHVQFERCETRDARKTRHTRASAPRGRPTFCDTISPSVRSRCNHRFVAESGRPAWSRSSYCPSQRFPFFRCQRVLVRTGPSWQRKYSQTLVFWSKSGCGASIGVTSRCCVSVCIVQKYLVCTIF